MNESTLKLSPLHIEVAIACGRTEPLSFGPLTPCLINLMLGTARHWEQMEEVRAKHGMEAESSPFHSTVMTMLVEINEIRVQAQRAEMRRRMEQNKVRQKIARRRKALRPHISRRVENERRERLHSEVIAREEGTTKPILSESGGD